MSGSAQQIDAVPLRAYLDGQKAMAEEVLADAEKMNALEAMAYWRGRLHAFGLVRKALDTPDGGGIEG